MPNSDDCIEDFDCLETLKVAKFIIKNGCCRECVKTFSKYSKVIGYFTFTVLSLSDTNASATINAAN